MQTPPKGITGAHGETLQVFVLRAFRQARKPMKPSQVAKRVNTLGYQTTSSPDMLLFSIERILTDEKLFRTAGRRLFELALPAAPRRKVGRPKRRAKAATKKPAPATGKEPPTEATEQPAPAPAEVKEV